MPHSTTRSNSTWQRPIRWTGAGQRCRRAMSRASSTSRVRMWLAMDQPTMRRPKASSTMARNRMAQPWPTRPACHASCATSPDSRSCTDQLRIRPACPRAREVLTRAENPDTYPTLDPGGLRHVLTPAVLLDDQAADPRLLAAANRPWFQLRLAYCNVQIHEHSDLKDMTEEHSITDALRNLPRLVREAAQGKTVELTRRGKPAAILIGRGSFERLAAG